MAVNHSDSIRCLSANLMYAEAYWTLTLMSLESGIDDDTSYMQKYWTLTRNIEGQFYDSEHHRFYYLIDHKGQRHEYQEGLGVSLALLNLDILNDSEVRKMMKQLKLSRYGIPSVYPSFPRNSKDKPGRHNMMIWPHINAFYAMGCAYRGVWDEFYRELENMATLAMVNGKGDFYEIYTLEGEPSGGWQCGALWDKKEHQTWCATGYLRLWLEEVFGLDFFRSTLSVLPVGMKDGSECTLSGLQWRGNDITITVRGKHRGENRVPAKILLNGQPTKDYEVKPNQGVLHYDITL